MVDGQQQRVAGVAPIFASKPGRTIVDISAIYQGQLATARRGVSLQPDRSVHVQDEFATLDRRATVRWAMVTFADVHIDGPGRATLRRDGKTLTFRVREPSDATLRIYPTDPPPAPIDAPNPGTRMIGFETSAPANHAQRIVVQLTPGSSAGDPAAVTPLAQW